MNSDAKWDSLDSIIEETKKVPQYINLTHELDKVKALNSKIEEDRSKFQQDYLQFMKERNLYFEKLKMIQQYVEEQQPNNNPAMLQIQQILNNIGRKKE